MGSARDRTNGTLMALTPSQIASLPADQQAQYMRGLSPAQQQLVQTEVQNQIVTANRRFMRQSVEKTAYMPVTGGSGVNAAYTAGGTTLYFDFPTVPGFAKGIIIHYSLTVTPATGTNATYAASPAAPWSIFSEVQVLYNGPQVRTHPIMFKFMDQLKGFSRGQRNQVLAGNNDATIAANIVGSTPVVVNAANTWLGSMYLPLNTLGEDTVPGVLPASGVGNKPQLKLQCATLVGMDPLLNVLIPTGGTGHGSSTITGNISCEMVYVDGTNMDSPAPLSLSWQNEPTLQWYWDTPLTPFSANTIQRQTISTKLKHWYVVSIIIDAQQSTSFAQWSNVTGFELGPDQVGQQTFQNWNISNNVPIYDFFDRQIRRPYGQDLDSGVIAWVTAPGRGVIDSDNRNGTQVLNMYPGGFPAATHAYQVAAVGGQGAVAGFAAPTPRVETFLISENSAGLKVS